ncbi:sigma-E processing peptidase SpoIIGA [Clostridium sp. CAG:440]|jgi:sigma-E processing peptidase spoIIGA|nr:sigma-E processing peptidase SpoIIGA [Clostridium sp. CAG:440]HJJ15138.1 sigma-E processing peptidase SpoIIGA [Clostridiaceae bacterium]
MTIYIDVVLFENLIMNYIILLATGIILKIKIKHLRLIIASLIGAIYSIFGYISNIKAYSNMILKIILSIIIIYVAYNPQDVKKMWKELLVFYLTSFAFGGAAFALIYIVKPQDILMKNGLFLGTYPLKTVILAAIVTFILIIGVFKIVKSKISKKDMFKDIKINIEGKEVQVKAMVDTGNMLKEPISGKPVIVVEHTLLYDILPKEILNNLEKILGGDIESLPDEIKNKYISKLKFIPFSSLGKQNGMLIGIKPTYVEVMQEENTKKEDVIIGIYNKSFTKNGEYRALIGIDLI